MNLYWRYVIQDECLDANDHPFNNKKNIRNDRPFLDTTLIGGQTLAEYMAGHVKDANLDPQLIEAYHLQYPGLALNESFSDHVKALSDNQDSLHGFLQGVKGKLFEVNEVNWLNDGHLPVGWHADIASSSTQPGYDIIVTDDHGQVAELIQAKAGDSAGMLLEHAQNHPDVPDVLVTHELAGIHHIDGLHIVDSGISNTGLEQHIDHNVDAVLADPNFHLPVVAGIFIAAEAVNRLRRGDSMKDVAEMVSIRSAGALGASGVAMLLAPPVSIAGAVCTRLLWSAIVRNVQNKMRDDKRFAQQFSESAMWSKTAAMATVAISKNNLDLFEKHENRKRRNNDN